MLFEVSYEVCNKVGGIYAVLTSKSSYVGEKYGDNYFFVGPYFPEQAAIEFEEQAAPDEIAGVIDELVKEGIKCHYGKWVIDGKFNTLLIDYSGYFHQTDNIKKMMWEFAQVDSLYADSWFNDPIVWSTAAAVVMERIIKKTKKERVVVHFHEWLCGAGLLRLKQDKVDAATVFTTHATVLGRALAAAGEPLYNIIEGKHDSQKNIELARWYNSLAKHTLEVASAKYADVFTTVSEVTAKESEYILGRKPEPLLLNGINFDAYPGYEEATIRRRASRRQMRDFLVSYFNRYYEINFFNIRSFFISGRYEFHNKGIDAFIEALGRLNERMKREKTDKNAVAFIFIPAGTRSENFEVLKNKALYEEIKDHVSEFMPEIEEEVLHAVTNGQIPEKLLQREVKQKIKKLSQHFIGNRGGTPPLCAFELSSPVEQDMIMQALWKNKLLNLKEDKVKVIYYPSYLSSADRLISLDYNDATLTCDVGVFPSYYEPWGYTPLETAAQCSIAVTTDLAGFGKFMEGKGDGVKTIRRNKRSWDDLVKDLSDVMFEVVNLSKEELLTRKINAKELASLADWRQFVKNYFTAYDTALRRHAK